jgi:flagellar hook-basal body complex protein FliE
MTDIRIGARELPLPVSRPPALGPSAGTVPFSTALERAIGEVNALQLRAGESIQRLARGEVEDVHQVMIAAEEAGVAFDLMMEIRNKLLDAYQELMRTQL